MKAAIISIIHMCLNASSKYLFLPLQQEFEGEEQNMMPVCFVSLFPPVDPPSNPNPACLLGAGCTFSPASPFICLSQSPNECMSILALALTLWIY